MALSGWTGGAPGAVENVHDVADELLVRDVVHGFGGESDFAVEMFRELPKQREPGGGFEFFPARNGLERDCRFLRRNVLTQSSFEMGMVTERIVLATKNIIQIRFRNLWHPNDDGVGRDIAQPLRASGEKAGQSANHVESWKHIHQTKQIADDDLAGLQPKTLGIDNAQSEDAFAESLTPPMPLQKHGITQVEHEEKDQIERLDQAHTEETKQSQDRRDHHHASNHEEEIDDPGEKSCHWPRQPLGKNDAFGRSN